MPLAFCETMLIELVLISLKTSFSVSPLSRLTPLKLESSASLSSWLRRSLNCVIRFLRTVLPPTVVVFAAPVSPLMTPPAVAPTTVRSVVERFWIETLPLSLDAFTLPVSEVLALMPADDLVDGLRRGAGLGERAVGVEARRNRGSDDRASGDHDVGGAVAGGSVGREGERSAR